MANNANESFKGITLFRRVWLRLMSRLLGRNRRNVRDTQCRSPTTSLLTRVLTWCSSRNRLIRTESMCHRRREYDRLKSSTTGRIYNGSFNYKLFRSPSLSDAIVKIRRTASQIAETASVIPASRCARQLWRRVQIATGINLRKAEDIVAAVEDLKHGEQIGPDRWGNSSRKQLESLFLLYLRQNAPDSDVALSFLYAMD